jgi:prefoldin alpha subunit
MAASPAQGQERLQRLAYEAQLLQAQGQDVGAKLEAVSAAAAQMREALAALSALEKSGGSGLVPLGAGVFAHGSMQTGLVVVDIGAGILAEAPPSEAIRIVSGRLKGVEDAESRLRQGAEKLSARMREIDSEARGLVGGARGGVE